MAVNFGAKRKTLCLEAWAPSVAADPTQPCESPRGAPTLQAAALRHKITRISSLYSIYGCTIRMDNIISSGCFVSLNGDVRKLGSKGCCPPPPHGESD